MVGGSGTGGKGHERGGAVAVDDGLTMEGRGQTMMDRRGRCGETSGPWKMGPIKMRFAVGCAFWGWRERHGEIGVRAPVRSVQFEGRERESVCVWWHRVAWEGGVIDCRRRVQHGRGVQGV